MNTWPSIQAPSYPLTKELLYPQVRNEYENGAVQSRPKWTRARSTFALQWGSMTQTDLSTLEAFFIANQGLAIQWTHPATAATYIVRFKEDSLKSTCTVVGRYRVEVGLEEI